MVLKFSKAIPFSKLVSFEAKNLSLGSHWRRYENRYLYFFEMSIADYGTMTAMAIEPTVQEAYASIERQLSVEHLIIDQLGRACRSTNLDDSGLRIAMDLLKHLYDDNQQDALLSCDLYHLAIVDIMALEKKLLASYGVLEEAQAKAVAS